MNIESYSSENKFEGLIKEYVHLSNDSLKKESILSVDDGCYDFMFLQKGTVTINYAGNKSDNTNLLVYTHQFKPPIKYTFDKGADYFTIKVQPWASSLFFPFVPQNKIVNLEKIFGPSIIELHQKIFEAKTFTQKVKLSETFLTGLNLKPNKNFKLVREICIAIYEAKGMITVNLLCDIFNMDRQFLNKIFFQHVKYTTKKFIILVRILNVVKFKMTHPSDSFTKVAYEFGYFDQAHFNYDFKRISGVTPTQLFKELPMFLLRHNK